MAESPILTVLHFNDVYHIEPRTKEPFAGAARFVTAIKSFKETNPFVLFSGDVFNPSIMSSVTKGKQMLPVLNACGVHCAVFGNHDFDFGVDTLRKLTGACNFPWLMSNVVSGEPAVPLANGLEYVILNHNGLRVGLFGLVEKEWLETLPVLPPNCKYIDFVESGRRMVEILQKEGVDLIVALTHMREPNDIELARNVDGIDLLLGGHDHFDCVHLINGTAVIKSGTDFRNLSRLDLTWQKATQPQRDRSETSFGSAVGKSVTLQGHRVQVTVECLEITGAYQEDPEMKVIVDDLCKDMDTKMKKPVGETLIALDCRVEANRTRESNIGSFLADIVRTEYDADIGLLCGGAIRSDDTYGPGLITSGDILNILPFEDMCMVVRVSGTQLLSILENGVSMYPKHEGRFPQVSGVRFIYDPALPPRSRVVKVWVGTTPANERLLDLSAHYTIATRGYMVSGKDGYDDLAKAEVVREEENGHLMSTLFRRFFMKLKVINAFKHSGHFVSMAQEIFRANRAGSGAALASLVTEKSTEKDHEKSEKSHEKGGEDSLARSSSTSSTHSISASTRWHKLGEAVHPSFLKLEPIVHGRILTVSEAKAQGVKF